MRRLKMMAICLLLLLLSACRTCPGGHEYIDVVNNSDRVIACQELWRGISLPEDTLYEDRIPAISIYPDSLYRFISLNEPGWECDFTAIPFIQFIIMDYEVYNKYRSEPCDTIRKYVPVLHRYQLTLEDLIRMDWTVVYPPE